MEIHKNKIDISIKHFENVTKDKTEIIERLLNKGFSEKEIIETFKTYSFKKQWKGNPIGIVLVLFSLFIIFTISTRLGFFEYNFRSARGFFNFNQFMLKPFLAISSFIIGLNLILNENYISKYIKFIMITMFVIYFMTLIKTASEIYYMAIISSIGIIIYAIIKKQKNEYSSTTQNIIKKIEKYNLAEASKWKGTHFFIILIFAICLLLNSPIDLTTIIINRTETSISRQLSLQDIDKILKYTLITLIGISFIASLLISVNIKKFKPILYLLIFVSLLHVVGTFYHTNYQESIVPAILILVISLILILKKKFSVL